MQEFSRVDGFLKCEFVKPGKSCHIIGSRNLYHRSFFGPYISSLEHLLRRLPEAQCISTDGPGTARALLELRDMSRFIETDHTAWDLHMSQPLLAALNDEYRRIFRVPAEDAVYFEEVLRSYLSTSWRFRNGLSYKLKGTRVSGDVDTTVGNTIIHIAVNRAVARMSGLSKADFKQRCKGDDSVIAEHGNPGKRFEVSHFRRLGLEVKASERSTIFDVEFCSSYLLQGETGWTMSRNPWKIVRHVPYVLGITNRKEFIRKSQQKSLCEALVSQGTPIMCALSHYWWRCAGHPSVPFTDRDVQYHYQSYCGGEKHVSTHARWSFERLWGITVADQLHCERYLYSLRVGDVPDHWVLHRLGHILDRPGTPLDEYE